MSGTVIIGHLQNMGKAYNALDVFARATAKERVKDVNDKLL